MGIFDVKFEHRHLLKKKNVVGIGVSFDKNSKTEIIVVSVAKKQPLSKLSKQDIVPRSLSKNGKKYQVKVIETGEFWALDTSRKRPVLGGSSIGHVDVTAGTLGAWVEYNGEKCILSNNHVLANSNYADIGDSILQPGSYDNGRFPEDEIAKLYEYERIRFVGEENNPPEKDCPIAVNFVKVVNWMLEKMDKRSRLDLRDRDDYNQEVTNYIDAALAKVNNAELIDSKIENIGKIKGIGTGQVEAKVQKAGRITDYTTGTITQIAATVRVNYGEGKVAIFEDQIITTPMSAGGDSGSTVLTMDNKVVGLLFAEGTEATVINNIHNVMSRFPWNDIYLKKRRIK